MPVITARKDGCSGSSAACVLSKSNATLDVRLSGIDKDDITAVTYQFGDAPVFTKTLGDGVAIGDDGLEIIIDAEDVNRHGMYNHYLEITDSSGTYKVFLNFPRVNVQ